MLENERQPATTGADEDSWLKRIAEINAKQERLLDLHLEGDVTTEQFRAKRAELEEARDAIESQLEAARSRLSRLKDIERSKDALVSYYVSLVPSCLQSLSPEDCRRIYGMMRLRVLAHRDGTLIADWGCNDVTQLPGSCRTRGR